MRYVRPTEYQILFQNMRHAGCLCSPLCLRLPYEYSCSSWRHTSPSELTRENVAHHHTVFARSDSVAWKRADLVGRMHTSSQGSMLSSDVSRPSAAHLSLSGNILLELLVNGGSLKPLENFSSSDQKLFSSILLFYLCIWGQ